jgi:hypothetical protein
MLLHEALSSCIGNHAYANQAFSSIRAYSTHHRNVKTRASSFCAACEVYNRVLPLKK